MSEQTTVLCAGCGAERLGPGLTEPGQQSPCPECGTSDVSYTAEITDAVKLRDCLAHASRGLRDDRRKDKYKGKVGHEFYKKDGRWRHVFRNFDHVNDWYDEVITDEETGDVVRECHEPLSVHQGRGSAKRSNLEVNNGGSRAT